ncbi:MAG: OsmC family protein [Crocinitomicaceae bacterium]
MDTVKIEYLGGLRTECTHLRSGTKILTDAPVDNKGKGEFFSPTDLVATAYGACMVSLIGIYCQDHDLEFSRGSVGVEKIMESNPRRIGELKIVMDLTGNDWDEITQKKIVRVAESCPVAKSVSAEIKITLDIQF